MAPLFSGFTQKASQATTKVVGKARDMQGINRLNTNISNENSRIQEIYLAIGEAYVEKHRGDSRAEFASQVRLVEEAENKIASYKEELLTLKKVVVCEKCGAELPEDTSFCSECGARIVKIKPKGAFCTNCGAALMPGARFCVGCGTPVAIAEAEPTNPPASETMSEASFTSETDEGRSSDDNIAADETAFEFSFEPGDDLQIPLPPKENDESGNAEMIDAPEASAPSERKGKFCSHCGARLEENDVFCTECGRKVE